MKEPATCGAGVAAHATLPARLGELVAALADTLEAHLAALDVADEDARKEADAYASLIGQHRRIADQLTLVAREMAGYHDLPMGHHIEAKLSSPEAAAAFRRYVACERALAKLMTDAIANDEQMLDEA